MRKLIVLLFACMFGVAACGGSDNKSDNASDTKSVDTTEAAAASGDGGTYCGLAAQYQGVTNFNPAAGGATDIKASAQNAKAALANAVKAAPSEIKADVKVFADAYSPFIEALAKANYDFTKINPQDPAFANIQKPEVAAAAQHIQAWAKAHCGTG